MAVEAGEEDEAKDGREEDKEKIEEEENYKLRREGRTGRVRDTGEEEEKKNVKEREKTPLHPKLTSFGHSSILSFTRPMSSRLFTHNYFRP